MLSLHKHSFKAMGSRCEIQFYASEAAASGIIHNAVARLEALEAKYTRYRPKSVTSQINRAAGGGEPVEVDSETAGLLNYAQVLFEQSDGLFDITSGILRRVWNFRSGKLPEAERLQQLLPRIGWQQVRWEAPYFYLPTVGMEIDFGGFVKEYAADQLVALLKAEGVEHGLVNLGGDIAVVGPHPDNAPWQVGIQHPRKQEQAIARIPMSRGAIATSGDYERFMLIDGERYCHLLNPRNGLSIRPQRISVTVIADQCLLAGSFASVAMLKSETDTNWLADSGVHYLQIDQNLSMDGNLVN